MQLIVMQRIIANLIIGINAKWLSLVMNGWWSCVHSYVLSSRGNLFVWIQIFRPIVELGACGGGQHLRSIRPECDMLITYLNL
jgi:hypothetical protein